VKRLSIFVLVLTLGMGLAAQAPAAQPAPAPHTNLKVGDTAPDFTLPSTTGPAVKLSDFRGKNVVVLAFFPAAFTGGCTKEMSAYQLNLTKFEGADTKVFGISTDNTPSQREFAKSLNVNFPILSDFKTRQVAKDYGVLNEGYGIANRTTFVVDKEGKIQYIEEGNAAVDVTGAAAACDRMAHKAK
jgi:peroxiredoxin